METAATWTAIAIIAAFGFGSFFYLGAKIDGLGRDLGARIDGQGASLGARIDGLSSRMDVMSARIDAQGAELGARMDALYERVYPPGKAGASP